MTEKLRMKESRSRSPTTAFTGRSCSKDQPRSPCSRPEKPFSPGQTPIQMPYCSTNGLSRPYCLRRNSAFSSAALSPWLWSSAIWLERKSPGGSWMITNVTKLITTSVGIMIRMRRSVYLSIKEFLRMSPPRRRGSSFRVEKHGFPHSRERRVDAFARPNSFEPERVRAINAEKRPRIPVIEAALRDVHQRFARDHRLRHAGDHADRELLLGVQLEHRVPGALAVLAVRRLEPPAIQALQLLRFGHVHRLAGLAAGLEVLAPLRPLVLRLRGRRELVGAVLRRGEPVLDSAPRRHDGLAGIDAVAPGFALRGLAEELDAHLAPGLADELEHVGVLGRFAGGLDDELERPTVRQPADAVVALLQADLVEQR